MASLSDSVFDAFTPSSPTTTTTTTSTTTGTASVVPGLLVGHSGLTSLDNRSAIYHHLNNLSFSEWGNSTTMLSDPTDLVGNHSYPPPFTVPAYIMAWVTLANILVFFVGVVGNLLVIVVVSCVRDMRTPTNLCLMNLSIADLLVLLICQPSALLEFYAQERWMLGDFMCKLTYFLENMVCLASILIILTVSFERYYAVCYPLKMYSSESRSKALVLMVIMWVAAAALNSPFWFMAYTKQEMHSVDLDFVPICVCPIELEWKRIYVIARFVIVFVVPFCLLVFLYSRIIFKVAVDTMDSRQMTDKARVQAQRSRQQLVFMLIGVVVLFFVCLLPFRIYAIYQVYRPVHLSDLEVMLNLIQMSRLLVYVNSAGNPIIYSLVSTKFRRAFARVLYRMGCRWAMVARGIHSEENGTLRSRNTVTHYTSVRQEQDDGPTDAV